MTLNAYSFELATKVVFGPGTIREAGREAKKLGMTKAMLIADQGIIGAGLTAPVEEALQEAVSYTHLEKTQHCETDTVATQSRSAAGGAAKR